jgi:(p)ppGpp synthase/HD superfamily hydrolase
MATKFIKKADVFAEYHFVMIDQRRKYTGEPYMVHPRAVAAIVEDAGGDEAQVAAALLHDTVEDTEVTNDEVREVFGDDVAELVFWVTKVGTKAHGNRKVRKALDREHYAQGPARAQTIKLADVIDNSSTVADMDPGFARVYLQELKDLVDVLKAGDKNLRKQARKNIEAGFKALNR